MKFPVGSIFSWTKSDTSRTKATTQVYDFEENSDYTSAHFARKLYDLLREARFVKYNIIKIASGMHDVCNLAVPCIMCLGDCMIHAYTCL